VGKSVRGDSDVSSGKEQRDAGEVDAGGGGRS
jgi:hypothetical protein